MSHFSAFEIRDAIGQLADGHSIELELLPVIRAAMTGLCPTSDRGEQRFVVGVSGANALHVDTEELIWPKDPQSELADDVPLSVITDEALWREAAAYWRDDDQAAWTAFVWRIAVPLANRLGTPGAWANLEPED